jgi:hypothetical protein
VVKVSEKKSNGTYLGREGILKMVNIVSIEKLCSFHFIKALHLSFSESLPRDHAMLEQRDLDSGGRGRHISVDSGSGAPRVEVRVWNCQGRVDTDYELQGSRLWFGAIRGWGRMKEKYTTGAEEGEGCGRGGGGEGTRKMTDRGRTTGDPFLFLSGHELMRVFTSSVPWLQDIGHEPTLLNFLNNLSTCEFT